MPDPRPMKVTAADGHVYHKSATANASSAPTNEATLKNANQQGALTEAQLDFVTIVQYEWGLQGELPSVNFLVDSYRYTPDQVLGNYSTPAIKKALSERGIELDNKHLSPVGLPDFKPSTKPTPKLTAIQLVAANLLLNLSDNRSERKKLSDLGIQTSTYQSWLRDPEFSGYLRLRAEAMIGDIQHEAMLSLADKVRAGDMKAITLYFELTGRFVPTSQAANNSGGSVGDLQTLIIRIIEIINDEVHDPNVASAISNKLRGLVFGGQVAGILPSPAPLAQPEVAEARELSPAIQALANQGLGYDQ